MSPLWVGLLPALSVPAGSGKLPWDGGALAAPQTSHDGGGGEGCTAGGGGVTLRFVSQGRRGTSHDAAGLRRKRPEGGSRGRVGIYL